ncbi:MAG: SpoIIE family protein phosphatase [Candidatus Latescibacteria bacterium]|nr:SpoIIE family protein phosphatase [Candidatus Latescibacterota bacterium]NIO56737.1 SpoIIE family protein phosphatase [Candidatus Latescibacterota bacterium]NIT02322.1 SpoIIE family protein phosphatase [Candidatus Latescibacterota bacterium]NIT39205.1 SpoIIE family protein phosphatase [Candidatus Latescibacterota bacterium]
MPGGKILSSLTNVFSRSPREPERREGPVDPANIRALQEENEQLKRALEELSILNDLARAIGASLDSEDIIEKIVRRSVRAVDAAQAVITLVDRHSDDAMKTLVRAMRTSSAHERFHLNQNLLGWMHLHKRPLLTNDPRNDERFRGVKWEESIHSLICVPLMVKSELIGVLTVYNKKGESQFTEADQRLLGIIAAQSAQVVENARLYEEEKEYALVQEQIRLARQIQIDLLPKYPPQVPGYDIAGVSIPAQEVGGDYFDFMEVDKNKLVVCLGDVSGKGLPASLLMANLQATLRGQTLLDISAGECLTRSNRLLFRSTDPEKFATLFYGVLDAEEHRFCFSNAGHENPILLSDTDEPVRLAVGGLVLGVSGEFPFEEEMISLKRGDLLVIFSDGITEAGNEEDEQFGDQKLVDLVRKHRSESASGLIEKIVEAVREHTDKAQQMDDITIVVVRRTD